MGFFGSFAGGLAQGVQNGMKMREWMDQREVQEMHKEGIKSASNDAATANTERFKLGVEDASAGFADAETRDYQASGMAVMMDSSNLETVDGKERLTDAALKKIYTDQGADPALSGRDFATAGGAAPAAAANPPAAAAATATATAAGVTTTPLPDEPKIKATPLLPLTPAATAAPQAAAPAAAAAAPAAAALPPVPQAPAPQPAVPQAAQPAAAQPATPAAAVVKSPGGLVQKWDTPEANATDIFAKKYMPAIQSKLMSQGKYKEADAFDTWAKERANAAYAETWAQAHSAHGRGDDAGAIQGLTKLYNNQVPDGMSVRVAKTGNEGGLSVEQIDNKTGKVVRSHTGNMSDIAKMGLGALSPMDQVKHMMTTNAALAEAGNKTHVVGGSLVTGQGKVLYEGTPDNDYTKYQKALASEVSEGRKTQQEADKLWSGFLAKRAEGQNTNIYNSMGTWGIGADGTKVSVQVDRKGNVRTTDTGVKDHDLAAKRAENASSLISNNGLYAKDYRNLTRGGAMTNSINERIARSLQDHDITPNAAVAESITYHQGYKKFVDRFHAAKPEEQARIRKEAHAAGYPSF